MLLEKVLIDKKDEVDEDVEMAVGYPLYPDRTSGDGLVCVDLNDFIQHCTIFGLPGTGKTYFLASAVDHFRQHAAGDVGIMILNYGKESQEQFYDAEVVLKFGDPRLSIPYFFPPEDKVQIYKVLQQVAENVVASMGMKYVVKKLLYSVMVAYWKKRHGMPTTLTRLFKALLKYIKDRPYGPEFQANLTRATQNRVDPFIANNALVRTLSLGRGGVPSWFEAWLLGKSVFIDLSPCDKFAKQLCTYSILQAIRTLVPAIETNVLKSLIVIDEAHQVLEKPQTNDPDDADHIAMMQIEAIFSQLLKEFRSKGVGIVLADQQPSSLAQCAYSQASLRFLFRVSYPCNTLFSSNQEIQEALLDLGNREALVLNGAQGRYEIVRTLDFTLPSKRRKAMEVTIHE